MILKEWMDKFQIPHMAQTIVKGLLVAKCPEVLTANIELAIDDVAKSVTLAGDGVVWWHGTFDDVQELVNGKKKEQPEPGPTPEQPAGDSAEGPGNGPGGAPGLPGQTGQ